MALTRKFLSALGIEAEKVDEIIGAHTETVDGLKAEIEAAKGSAEEVKRLEAENKKLKSELQEARDSAEKPDTYKVKYEAIKEEFDDFKKQIEAEKSAKTKKDAFREFLKGLGISEKRLDAVIKVSDLSKIEIDEDGKVKDTEHALADRLKKEWEDFIVTSHDHGADTSHPPKTDGGSISREEIYKKDEHGRYVMDAGARQKALAEQMANEKG